MATDIAYVNYKEFVAGLSDAETPDETDKAVVCNETDGPRAIPLNAKALTTAADETDLNENSSIDIYTAGGRKRLPGNAIAKAGDVSELRTDAGSLQEAMTSAQSDIATLQTNTSCTPLYLGVRSGVVGSLNTSTGFITKTLLKNRVTFAYMLCGKGTRFEVVAVDESNPGIVGFSVCKYDPTTGEYIESIGNVVNNTDPVTLDDECYVAVYVNTDAEDVTDSAANIGSRVRINYVAPVLNPVPYLSDFEQGSFTDGVPSTNAKRLRTTLFVKVGKGSVISTRRIDQGYQLLKYDMQSQTYKSITGSYRHLPCLAVDEDCYIKLLCINDADVEMSASDADYFFVKKVSDDSYYTVYKTPYQLGVVAGECGYLNTSSAQINRSLNKNYAQFGFIHFGKGSKISLSIGSVGVVGVSVALYNEKTGAFVETVGNSSQSSSRKITIPYDCVGVITVKGTDEDVSSALNSIEKQVWIDFVEPLFEFNKFPCNFESGSLDRGQPIANANRARSVEFVLMGKGSVIYLPNISDGYIVNLYSVKNKGWYLGTSLTHLPCYQLQEDAYVKVIEAHDVSSSFDASVIYMKALVMPADSLALPLYYFENDYIQDVCSAINSHDEDCGFGGDTFVFITDVHWASNLKKSPALIDYIKAHTTVRNIIFGGDATNIYASKDAVKAAYDEWRDVMREFKYYGWLPTIGNHEFGLPSTGVSVDDVRLSASEAYALVTKENEAIIHVIDEYSYYYDNVTNKIRYVVVGCSGGATIPSATSSAVIGVLDALPEGYQVIVVSHIGIEASSLTLVSSIQGIVDKLDSMQANNSVIGVFSGHRHVDGHVVTEAGTHIIATTCDAFAEYESSSLTRTRGTITEQAFDVVQIDTTNRKIYMTRVGAGEDRVFDY